MRRKIMGSLHEDLFRFMISDEKCFKQNSEGKSKNIIKVKEFF
jgi:hypothetical protein